MFVVVFFVLPFAYEKMASEVINATTTFSRTRGLIQLHRSRNVETCTARRFWRMDLKWI